MARKLIHLFIDNFVLIAMGIAGIFVYLQVATRNRHQRKAQELLDYAIKSSADEPLTMHPEIDPNLCAGCGACTRVCPEGDILKLIDHKAVLVSPTKCVGHGECEAACPFEAIKLVFGTKRRGMDIPRLTTNYETNVPGLYIAGELGGMGLIRNATKQGMLAAEHALNNLPKARAQYDLLVVGAGPAGFSACLAAIAKKHSYLCIEQNSFGGTIYNFPRQKIVMSHPFLLPIVGKATFMGGTTTKEKLLDYFTSIRSETGLTIKEKVKFESLEKTGEIFTVQTSAGAVTARCVILAMGLRGSPRRLGVPGEDTPKVTYSLLDPDEYHGKNIVVVGGGNAGVEAAQMLGSANLKNKVHLLIRGADFDRCNDENKKIILKMAEQKLVTILHKTVVAEILPDRVKINSEGRESHIANDYVFVFAGAEMPHKFLMGLGIKIDKKFGETLGA